MFFLPNVLLHFKDLVKVPKSCKGPCQISMMENFVKHSTAKSFLAIFAKSSIIGI